MARGGNPERKPSPYSPTSTGGANKLAPLALGLAPCLAPSPSRFRGIASRPLGIGHCLSHPFPLQILFGIIPISNWGILQARIIAYRLGFPLLKENEINI